MSEKEDFDREARARWGDTPQYKESNKRIKSYSKEDFVAAKADNESAIALLITAMNSSSPATSELAKSGAQAHKQAITDWYYECSYEMHRNLAQMYLTDSRFTQYYESHKQGLTQYLHDAILANAEGR